MRGPRVRFPAARLAGWIGAPAPLVAARTAAGALLAAVALLAPPLARAQAPALEVWVLNEASRSITVLDPLTNGVLATIDVSDPDGNSVPDTPRDMAFSTRPAAPGAHAFVVQGRLVTVVSVATRTIVRTVDVTTLSGIPAVTLTGCATSVPRRFGSTIRNHLHVAATRTVLGGAMFVVLDQDALVTGTGAPLVGQGLLTTTGRSLNVRVLDEPAGPRFARAWYTVANTLPATEVRAIEVSTGPTSGGPWTVGEQRIVPLATPAGLPEVLRPGSPTGPELPVLPLATEGVLENLDTTGTCSLGGDLGAVSVSGPGANSYTVLALDRATDEIVVVDPTDCTTVRLPTGGGPADVTTIGRSAWTTAWVADHDGDSVTRLDATATSPVTVPLGPLADGPIAIGIANAGLCNPTDLDIAETDADLDGQVDDLTLTWDAQGCAGTFWVFCQCTDFALDCPCRCDCSVPGPAPGCMCPGLIGGGLAADASMLGGGLTLQPGPWDPPVIGNPWKRLGSSATGTFNHLSVLDLDAGWVYSISMTEAYP